ncbi:unnamed protein product [Closterium sp. Yama58-4]|nr:unnamed protein product [Closterium sp. Yama58-4]
MIHLLPPRFMIHLLPPRFMIHLLPPRFMIHLLPPRFMIHLLPPRFMIHLLPPRFMIHLLPPRFMIHLLPPRFMIHLLPPRFMIHLLPPRFMIHLLPPRFMIHLLPPRFMIHLLPTDLKAIGGVEPLLRFLKSPMQSSTRGQQPSECLAIGGLEPLLRFLKSPHAILRARAAEVVTTMVQNNEKSQRSVMEAGGHLTLMDMLLNDADVTARTKAVGAISSLVRHNPEGLASLRAVVGIKGLTSLISSAAQPTTDTTTTSSATKLLLKALHLTLYFLQQFPSDQPQALSSGLRKGDEVSETEAVIGVRIEAVSALQKRQSSGENSGGSDGASEPESGDLQEELDALLETRRALIGRKVAVARGRAELGPVGEQQAL